MSVVRKVLTTLNFLTTSSFSITTPSYQPWRDYCGGVKRSDLVRSLPSALAPLSCIYRAFGSPSSHLSIINQSLLFFSLPPTSSLQWLVLVPFLLRMLTWVFLLFSVGLYPTIYFGIPREDNNKPLDWKSGALELWG